MKMPCKCQQLGYPDFTSTAISRTKFILAHKICQNVVGQ